MKGISKRRIQETQSVRGISPPPFWPFWGYEKFHFWLLNKFRNYFSIYIPHIGPTFSVSYFHPVAIIGVSEKSVVFWAWEQFLWQKYAQRQSNSVALSLLYNVHPLVSLFVLGLVPHKISDMITILHSCGFPRAAGWM